MATLMCEISSAMQRLGWILIERDGMEISRSPRRHLSGPPIGKTRLFSPESGFVADIGAYGLVIWHVVSGTPGRGKHSGLEELEHALRCGGEAEFAKRLAQINA